MNSHFVFLQIYTRIDSSIGISPTHDSDISVCSLLVGKLEEDIVLDAEAALKQLIAYQERAGCWKANGGA